MTTIYVSPSTFSARIQGYGETVPRHHLSLSAEVSGRVVRLASKLESGSRFGEGEVLLNLDDTAYQQALASAQHDLASAEVELLEEELNARQARQEWQRSGLEGKPDSPLVLHEPQLKAAKAKVAKYQRSVSLARSDLAKTQIRAPFDALLINRSVQPGSYVQNGTPLAELYSTDVASVSIPLSDMQWALLPDTAQIINEKTIVQLFSSDAERSWEGRIARVEQHVDKQNRQRSLVVEVAHPLDQEPPLYPSTFVTAEIPGKQVAGLWRLPASALTQDGKIWYVDNAGQLVSETTEIVFSSGNFIYVQPPSGLTTASVVVYPLSSYLPGMQVAQRPAEKKP
ncbi:MAG: efflux RND transporter periplasmic adaptor subunit [Chromatiales bacterium]|nr:efflux RND transporter periplasmic adaptor subunit [Chromatiales bacterium]